MNQTVGSNETFNLSSVRNSDIDHFTLPDNAYVADDEKYEMTHNDRMR